LWASLESAIALRYEGEPEHLNKQTCREEDETLRQASEQHQRRQTKQPARE